MTAAPKVYVGQMLVCTEDTETRVYVSHNFVILSHAFEVVYMAWCAISGDKNWSTVVAGGEVFQSSTDCSMEEFSALFFVGHEMCAADDKTSGCYDLDSLLSDTYEYTVCISGS